MIYIIALSVITGILGFYYLFLKDINFFKKHGIPHITPTPILGNMGPILFRRQSIADFVKKIYNISPDAKYVGMYEFTVPITIIRDLELIKSIIVRHSNMFMDHRTFVTENQDPLFGKSIFSLNGEKWKNVRPLLTPAFTSSKMKNMFNLIFDYGANFANFLAQLPPEKRMIETKDTFTRYANDVTATCIFGVSVDSIRNPKNQFYVYSREATSLGITAFMKFYIFRTMPWLARQLRLKIVRDEIANFFKTLIETTIKTRDENGIVRSDMLQQLMETRNKDNKTNLTIEEMLSQAFMFFFSSFDSTSTLMCFTAHELAVNPDVQKKLQNEIDQVLEDTNGQLSYEALMDMEYLEAVISEALRMYPIAIAFDRLCSQNFELPPTLPGSKPFTIKKGQAIGIPIYGLHHDPKYFPNPEKFDPERFLNEQKKDNHNCGAYLSFGLGPRMCIGNKFALMETKVLLFHVLARCDLKVCEKTVIPIKIAKGSFIMKSESDFWLTIVPRKNPHRCIVTNVVNGTCDP